MSGTVEPGSSPAEGQELSGSGLELSGSGLELLVGAREKELGGMPVRRVLPYFKRRMIGPWIFLDHMGPVDFAPGQGVDIIPHPHIGLATVTYLFEGQLLHRDSLGMVQAIEPGAINLMVAGKGIAHSERSVPELRAGGFRLHGLQLWLALPEEQEDSEPAFYHYEPGELPWRQSGGADLRVMFGEAFGLVSPVKTFSPTLYAEARLEAGARLDLPAGLTERALYVVAGKIRANGETVPEHTLAACRPGAEIRLEAEQPARIALIGGEPLGPRYIWWNFVSSRQERLEQAGRDWQAGRFAAVPGDPEFTPLPPWPRLAGRSPRPSA